MTDQPASTSASIDRITFYAGYGYINDHGHDLTTAEGRSGYSATHGCCIEVIPREPEDEPEA
ncbi:hypothetical protein EV383_6274 [Pseudonocardia sediminis]|uniref:Uncharacterized protein n=1 Tax=Pseudonocardia sediminis TaxID=1397368 RepID=A0A4Q7UAA5_PSEST|nr:hypothetical protein [Pseudonocardia sediminis]RZT75533.1 hypothetical protein EV383_6274 [Pseudonocardia sediminis]